MVIFHSYINIYQGVKIMIELILIGEKLSACDSVIPHSNGNSQPRWSKSYWFLLCMYIYIYIYIYIYYITYIMYVLVIYYIHYIYQLKQSNCVLSIYAYLHIISSNGRPKYNIMYVCIYYIILYIYIYCTYGLNYTRQHADVCVFTCTHSFTLWVLHCWHHITLDDITWHHMTLHYITYTLHACM